MILLQSVAKQPNSHPLLLWVRGCISSWET